MSKRIGIISFWAIRVCITLSLIPAFISLIKWESASINPLIHFFFIALLTWIAWIAKYTHTEKPETDPYTDFLIDRDKAARCNNHAFRESMLCYLEMESHPLLEEARQIWEEFQDDYLFRITLLHRHGAVTAEDYYQDILTLYGKIQTGQKTVDIGLFEQCEGE